MRKSRSLIALTLGILLVGFLACNRDPNARKQKYFESGNRYFAQGKYHEAAIEFLNAIKIDPQFAKAHYLLAKTSMRLGAWPDAYRELKRTVEIDPGNVAAQIDLGNLLISAHSFAEAQTVVDKLLKLDPNSADVHALQADLDAVQNNRQAALKEQQTAIALDPQRLDSYLRLAALQNPTQSGAAEATLKKALLIDPKFVPAIESLAALYQKNGRTADAEDLLKRGIELDPKNFKARQNLAEFYLSQNRKTDAEQVIYQAKNDLSDQPNMYRLLGDYYVETDQLDKAAAEFAVLSKQRPKDLSLREDFIELLLRQNKVDEANRLNDAILDMNPKDSGAQMLRGRILNLRGEFKAAIDVLQAALKDAPEHAGGHYQLGVALSNTGNNVRAEEEWRQAVKLEPRLTDAQLALAQVALAKNDRNSLSDAAEAIITNLPSDPRGYVLRAEAESRSNQNAAAEADFNKAIQIAPQSSLGYSALAGWLFKSGKLQDAQKYYELALDRDPNQVAALNGLVAVLLRLHQNAKAQKRVEQQVDKEPTNDAFLTLLGGLQAANKDFAGADESLQKAIRLSENNIGAVLLLSNVERAQGSIDKALATAYRSLEQNPKSPAAYFLAGSLEDSRGQWQKAEGLYQHALQVEPNYAPAANNLAYGMLEHHEDNDVALSLAQIARQKMPDSASAADTLAWIYYQKGIYGTAATLLQEALQKSPDNATYHYHIGMVYQKQNNPEAARKHLQRALEISPNSPASGEIRRALSQLS
jgi:tetratricopeptide (TPR) repeat protein